MGLFVTAYSNLAKTEHPRDDGDRFCGAMGHVQAYCYAKFPRSFEGIPVVRRFNVYGLPLLYGGCWGETPNTGKLTFDAGSYTAYVRWRDDLARQLNPRGKPGRPFGELIHFSDHEGVIGPVAAAKLARDFAEHRGSYVSPGGHGQRVFDDFHRAMLLAADGGLVYFR